MSTQEEGTGPAPSPEEPAARARFTAPIGTVLALGFGAVILAAVGLALYLGFSDATDKTRTLLKIRAEAVLDELVSEIGADLDPLMRRAEWVAAQVETGNIDPGDIDAFDSLATGMLAGARSLGGMALILADGRSRFYRARKGGIEIKDLPDHPAVHRFRSRLETLEGPVWNDPMLGEEGRQVVLTLLTPLRRDGKALAALGQGLTISDISDRLKAVAEGTGVTPFILFGGTRVLGHPFLANSRKKGAGWVRKEAIPFGQEGVSLPPLRAVKDPYLPSIWSPDDFKLSFMGKLEKSQARGVWVNDERRIFIFREISRYGSQPWIIGAHFGPEIARGDIMRLIYSGLAGIAVLCIAVLCAIWLARVTTRPIRNMAGAAAQVREGKLDRLPPLPPTVLRELNNATESFNRMVEGLRERDLIRSLFGTYVPQAVATAIVEDGGALVPQSANATVLFADLAGFTTMSERLQPQEIVDVLNGYFSTVVEIIERHGGVITQFQGDAVLAIFNVPLADPDHAENAVRAAIEMHRAIKDRAYAGQVLSCRIGINTGDVVAGSVGAGGRLSYTVHGDAVNLAARLEQLNKEYGTPTLVSGATAERISAISLRRIGEVEIRGKSEKVSLFAVE